MTHHDCDGISAHWSGHDETNTNWLFFWHLLIRNVGYLFIKFFFIVSNIAYVACWHGARNAKFCLCKSRVLYGIFGAKFWSVLVCDFIPICWYDAQKTKFSWFDDHNFVGKTPMAWCLAWVYALSCHVSQVATCCKLSSIACCHVPWTYSAHYVSLMWRFIFNNRKEWTRSHLRWHTLYKVINKNMMMMMTKNLKGPVRK